MIVEPVLHSKALETLPGGYRGWPVQGKWRYADYLRLPNDGRRYEIIKGVLYVANAPSYEHQYTVLKLGRYLDEFVEANQLGVIISAPFEVHLAEFSRPVQPDVLFLNNKQKPVGALQSFEGSPSLIVEVISLGSIRIDRKVKFDAYEQAGVQEYWLVDPKTRSIEIYTLSSGEYALLGQYTGDEFVESKVLIGITLATQSLFAPLQS